MSVKNLKVVSMILCLLWHQTFAGVIHTKNRHLPPRKLYGSFRDAFWFGFLVGAVLTFASKSLERSNKPKTRALMDLALKMQRRLGLHPNLVDQSKKTEKKMRELKEFFESSPTYLKAGSSSVRTVRSLLQRKGRQLADSSVGKELMGFLLGFYIGTTFVNIGDTVTAKLASKNKISNIQDNRKLIMSSVINENKISRPFYMIAVMGEQYARYHRKISLAKLKKAGEQFRAINEGHFTTVNDMVDVLLH